MKANKLMRTLAASAMSLALLAGVTALPAMAANPSETNSFTAKSTLRVAENIATPAVTLTYTVAPGTADERETHSNMNVYDGVAGGATGNSVVYTASAAGTNVEGEKYYEDTKEFTITTDASQFSHPGVYKYTVTVSASPSIDGLSTAATKNLYVFVKDGTSGEEVYSVVMGKDPAKSDTFVTTYLLDDDGETPIPEQYTADILVNNTVTGNLGDKTYPFSYTVTIPAGYNYQTGTMGEGGFVADGTGNKMTEGTATTLTLKHNQAVKFFGVKDGQEYTIAQNDADTMGYKTTVNGGDYAPVTDNIVKNVNVTATFTNYRDTSGEGVNPTGIIMNVAPYALMVVIALAGVMVFMRKRVED